MKHLTECAQNDDLGQWYYRDFSSFLLDFTCINFRSHISHHCYLTIDHPRKKEATPNKGERTNCSRYFRNIKGPAICMKESTQNEQLEKRFFEILNFFENQGSILYQNWVFIFPPWLGKWVYTQADNRRISIADSSNFVAMASTAWVSRVRSSLVFIAWVCRVMTKYIHIIVLLLEFSLKSSCN